MYFLPFCSCPSYQFCLLMFCQDILEALSQLSSASLLFPWFQSHPWCSTLFYCSIARKKKMVYQVCYCSLSLQVENLYSRFLILKRYLVSWENLVQWQCDSVTGILSPRPEGCTSISPVPGHGSSPVLQLSARLLEEQHSGWNAALKHLVLVAAGQVEVEISQRRIFTFFIPKKKVYSSCPGSTLFLTRASTNFEVFV